MRLRHSAAASESNSQMSEPFKSQMSLPRYEKRPWRCLNPHV